MATIEVQYTVTITLQAHDADLTGFDNGSDLIHGMLKDRLPSYMNAVVERSTKDYEIALKLNRITNQQ